MKYISFTHAASFSRWRFGFLGGGGFDEFVHEVMGTDPGVDCTLQQCHHVNLLLMQPFQKQMFHIEIDRHHGDEQALQMIDSPSERFSEVPSAADHVLLFIKESSQRGAHDLGFGFVTPTRDLF